MSNALTWSETNIDRKSQAGGRWRLASFVFWQVALVSVAAYISQMLIFDETNWYKIDLYDALTWGLVVTQVFALAIYVSRYRVNTIESSLRIFLCIAGLAVGLTAAATAFLVMDAYRNSREVVTLLFIAPGYCVAVFVFLVSMFLQLRLAIICLHVFRPMLGRKRVHEPLPTESSFDELTESEVGAKEKYSIADIFAFTGLAAVSISAYRLVLGVVTDYDALRFLAMFYAASITAFCVYALLQLNLSLWVKGFLILVAVFAFAYADFQVAQRVRSPLLRFGFNGMLLCNLLVAGATVFQMRFVERFVHLGRRAIQND